MGIFFVILIFHIASKILTKYTLLVYLKLISLLYFRTNSKANGTINYEKKSTTVQIANYLHDAVD